MHIDIPQVEQQRLAALAAEAGYDDVTRFVTDHIRALAQCSTTDKRAPLSPSELADSLALCDESMAEFKNAPGLSIQESRDQTHAALGRRQP